MSRQRLIGAGLLAAAGLIYVSETPRESSGTGPAATLALVSSKTSPSPTVATPPQSIAAPKATAQINPKPPPSGSVAPPDALAPAVSQRILSQGPRNADVPGAKAATAEPPKGPATAPLGNTDTPTVVRPRMVNVAPTSAPALVPARAAVQPQRESQRRVAPKTASVKRAIGIAGRQQRLPATPSRRLVLADSQPSPSAQPSPRVQW